MSFVSFIFSSENSNARLLCAAPLAIGAMYLVGQGYLRCGRPEDPNWGARAALFTSQKPLPGPIRFDDWASPGEAHVLRASVSRQAKANAHLSNIFVVRDKPMTYLMRYRREPAPLHRPHVDGYPLVFCGHAEIDGRIRRFSYMPKLQELILLEWTPRAAASSDRVDRWPTNREIRLEREFRRMCGRSLEAGAALS